MGNWYNWHPGTFIKARTLAVQKIGRSLSVLVGAPLLSLFFLALFQAPATASDVRDAAIQAALPAPLPLRFSADSTTMFNGLPVKAVINDPNPAVLRRVPAPADLLAPPEHATASFSITYVPAGGTDPWGEPCFAFPDTAKAAFVSAANIWANALVSSVPITISACWADLGSTDILGYSGGGPLHRDFMGAGFSGTWYTGALANALHGSDLAATDSDMYITYNKGFNWYYGTDGNPGASQHDLVTVVLHEICHGLNFAGSMSYDSGTGQGGWGYGVTPKYPNVYDRFMRDGSGTQILNAGTYPNPSTALGSALKSNNIWFHGGQAMAANGGQRVKIYAPFPWQGGSSYSHLDYTTFNDTSNQLMVYAVSAGESIHDPGTITNGLLKDLGWNPVAALPTVTISANDPAATEAATTTGQFTVTRTGATAAALAVNFAVTGTATPGSDYASIGTSVTIGAGSSKATLTVTPVNDTEVESPETVVATLSADAAYTVGTPSSATVTIASDDLPPKVQFSAAASSGAEGTPSAVINVTLSAPSSQTVTVHYATANGTATAPSDYTAVSGTVTFIPGNTSVLVVIPIVGDTVVEPNETFAVTLTAPVNATLGAITRHTYTIANDDGFGSIRLSSAAYSVNEGDGTVTITATRTGGSSGIVGVSYTTANGTATAGSDYTATSGKLTWLEGDSSDKYIVVPITNDALDEADSETFAVRLSTPTGGATLVLPSSGIVTIADNDDPPTIRFGPSSASSGAESTTPAVFYATLSAASSRTVTVKYATANGTAISGSDYTAMAGILTFTPGVTSQRIAVPIVNDTKVEDPADESFTVTLSAPVNATLLGGTQVQTYTIRDEDLHGAIKLSSFVYSTGEAGLATITALRIGGSSGAVSVSFRTSDLTATAGSDYTAVTKVLEWADGDKASKPITIEITPDALDEPNETFRVRLEAPTDGAILGAPVNATVTIVDDDLPPKVQFSLATATTAEATTPALIDVSLSAASANTVTVKYATANGTATAGSDYTMTAGTLTFPPGDTKKTISVPIINDAAVESEQTFTVTLSTPVNATLGAIPRYTCKITSDDLDVRVSRLPTLAVNDFDGDGRSDFAAYDEAQGLWRLRQSTDGDLTDRLGSAGSVPVTGDFDGDGRSDFGVYDAARGLWHLRRSASGDLTDRFGSAGALPVAGDFDGDGRCDYGVFDPVVALWSLRLSAKGDVTVTFGSAGTVPVTGDFDGDGASDYGCYTPATGGWEIALSSGGLRTETLGGAKAIPIVGDFDGDGTADFGVFTPATPGEDGAQPATAGSWQVLKSAEGFRTETFGEAGARPAGYNPN